MADIGGEAVDIVRGLPQALKERVDTWEVPGIAGVGAQTLGPGDAEFELTTITYCEDNDAANLHIENCNDLQGTIISMVDNFDDPFDNVLVKHVDTRNSKRPCIYLGNADAVRVEIHWTMVTAQ